MKNKRQKKTKNINPKFYLRTLVILLLLAFISFTIILVYNPVENENGNRTGKKAPRLGQGKVTFLNDQGEEHISVVVEIARDDYTRAMGLMFRENLPETQGMLFIFEKEKSQYFWMKNTPVSLDMIFVNSQNKIVNIEKYTKPYSLQSYPSIRPAIMVIEVVAGFSERHSVSVGDSIFWNEFTAGN